MMNGSLVTKNLYKIFLSLVKFIPNFLAIIKIITLILHSFNKTSFVLTCIGGTSVTLLVLLYLISYIFKFCGIYRLSLNYVTLVTVLSIYDWYIGLPISQSAVWRMYSIITGVFMTSWIIIWYTHRHNPKIDHIKQLCDKYADCGC